MHIHAHIHAMMLCIQINSTLQVHICIYACMRCMHTVIAWYVMCVYMQHIHVNTTLHTHHVMLNQIVWNALNHVMCDSMCMHDHVCIGQTMHAWHVYAMHVMPQECNGPNMQSMAHAWCGVHMNHVMCACMNE